jgi:hypothetical protein
MKRNSAVTWHQSNSQNDNQSEATRRDIEKVCRGWSISFSAREFTISYLESEIRNPAEEFL